MPAWVVVAVLSFAGSFCAPTVASQPGSLAPKLSATLGNLPHDTTEVGACVIDLATKDIVFQKHADKPLIPASTMKIFALASALQTLGPEFVFRTTLAYDGGRLAIVGDGDPAIADEQLAIDDGVDRLAAFAHWADALAGTGVANVSGGIIADTSIFDEVCVHPSWEPGDLNKWYGAPVSALNINGNCLDITASPSSAGAPARIDVFPPNSAAEIINKCRTGNGRDPILHLRPGTLEYVISGYCHKVWPFVAVPFPDPPRLFAEALRDVLRDRGIRVGGALQFARVRAPDGSLPAPWRIVATHETSLVDVARRVGKNSQNMFAEALLKRTGYAWAVRNRLAKPVGSWETGRQAALGLVAHMGIDQSNLVVDDGSGLSRSNRATAHQLAQVLSWAGRQPFADLFAESLSIAGVDGSLSRRLRDVPNRVYGKTGTMRSVRTLAGYVLDDSGRRRYSFAVMFNGYKGPSSPYRRLQDEFCRTLIGTLDTSIGSTN